MAIARYIVDNSTAVQLRLMKSKKKAVKETFKRQVSSSKFRDYSFRGTKKTPLKDFGLIEKKVHRIDTIGEKMQLSAAKVRKNLGFSIRRRGRKL